MKRDLNLDPALDKVCSRVTDAAEVRNLRFHALRRWFASVLEGLGDVEEEEAARREVVKYLLGHQPADTFERHYLVRSKGCARKLREAVEQLADRYNRFLSEGPTHSHSN